MAKRQGLKPQLLDFSAGPYFIGNKGGSCEEGGLIMNKQECKYACDTLSMVTGAMRDNKACYLAGNGKCRQDGKYKPGQSTKTSPICKNDGNTAYHITLDIICFRVLNIQYFNVFVMKYEFYSNYRSKLQH